MAAVLLGCRKPLVSPGGGGGGGGGGGLLCAEGLLKLLFQSRQAFAG